MAKNGAVIVFCSSCKILYFASLLHSLIFLPCLNNLRLCSFLSNSINQGPSHVVLQILGFYANHDFCAFLGISGRFYEYFRCLWAAEIHRFCLKSQFL